MMTPTRLRRTARRGFSLVELMVVIAIIGVLASAVTVALVKRAAKAKTTRAQADIKTIADALEMYKVDDELGNGKYPNSLQELVDAELLKSMPQDPWKNEYIYQKQGNTSFTIISYGADGASGGTGEDEDISSDDVLQ